MQIKITGKAIERAVFSCEKKMRASEFLTGPTCLNGDLLGKFMQKHLKTLPGWLVLGGILNKAGVNGISFQHVVVRIFPKILCTFIIAESP